MKRHLWPRKMSSRTASMIASVKYIIRPDFLSQHGDSLQGWGEGDGGKLEPYVVQKLKKENSNSIPREKC